MLLIFIEVTAPMIATVQLKVVTAISLALILLPSPIPFQTLEVDKLVSFTVQSLGQLLQQILVALSLSKVILLLIYLTLIFQVLMLSITLGL
jgi:hypothetical protein